jgi:hypothetical protein
MKRSFLAKTKASKSIGIYSVADIAALLNANTIQGDYVATECTVTTRLPFFKIQYSTWNESTLSWIFNLIENE